MTFYCVQSEFYDNGTVKAAMFEANRKTKPENSNRNTAIADCYKDWFDTKGAAEKYLKEAKGFPWGKPTMNVLGTTYTLAWAGQ